MRAKTLQDAKDDSINRLMKDLSVDHAKNPTVFYRINGIQTTKTTRATTRMMEILISWIVVSYTFLMVLTPPGRISCVKAVWIP